MIYHLASSSPVGGEVRVEVSIREDEDGDEYLVLLALDQRVLKIGDAEPSTMSPRIYAA